MTIQVKHLFESAKADGVDSTVVQPSDWNEDHVLTMATAKVLGRMTAGSGAVEELPIAVDATGQSMVPPSGTTGQRPASPVAGMIRYNTTTSELEAYQNSAWGNFSDIALASMADSTVKGRAVGSGSGTPADLTRAQVQRLVYNIGTAYPTFNTTADDGFVFPFGQNLNRTTYAALFAKYGTTYGAGDGSTTFGMPDVRGRVIAGKDDMGGTSANRLTNQSGGLNGDTLGATGGTETHTLTSADVPAHTHTFTTNTDGAHTHTKSVLGRYGANGDPYTDMQGGAGDSGADGQVLNIGPDGTHSHSGTTASSGSGGAHNNVQPTIVANYQIYTGVHA